MKVSKRLLALALAAAMALSVLTGCNTEGEETTPQEEVGVTATAGGSIQWPEGMDTTLRFSTQTDESTGTMYMVFNNVQNRFSEYFTAASDSITITSYATTESPSINEYLVTLWKEGSNGREYLDGYTMTFATGGECQTAQFTGLQPGQRYKIGLSFLSGIYYISGGLTVQGLAAAETASQ